MYEVYELAICELDDYASTVNKWSWLTSVVRKKAIVLNTIRHFYQKTNSIEKYNKYKK